MTITLAADVDQRLLPDAVFALTPPAMSVTSRSPEPTLRSTAPAPVTVMLPDESRTAHGDPGAGAARRHPHLVRGAAQARHSWSTVSHPAVDLVRRPGRLGAAVAHRAEQVDALHRGVRGDRHVPAAAGDADLGDGLSWSHRR